MIFWILYLLSFLLYRYENKTIVLPIEKRPLIFHRPFFQPLLWVMRLACQYGSIAGLWYVYNLPIAIIAFIINYAFGKFTFKIYFNREVVETAAYLANSIREEAEAEGERLNEEQIHRRAREKAYDWVLQNMRTGGR